MYFQDDVSGDAFDIPGKALCDASRSKKDKIFAVVGLGWGHYSKTRRLRPVAASSGSLTTNCACRQCFPSLRWSINQMTIGISGISANLTFLAFGRMMCVSHTEQKLQLHNAVVQYSEYRAGVQVGYSGFKHV